MAAMVVGSALTVACAGSGGTPPDARSMPPRAESGVHGSSEASGGTADAEALRRALRAAIAEPEAADELHLVSECLGETGWRSVELFGNGVGIWSRRRQFRLSASEVSKVLALLEEADFAGLADRYGGRPAEERRPPAARPDPASAVELVCRVELSLRGLSKSVAQFAKGEQSPVLRRLAESLLERCRQPGEAGLAVDSLEDGLARIARGELAPEVLSILLSRKPERAAAEDGEDGFLMRLSGPRVVSRVWDPVEGHGDPRTLELSAAEAAELARSLAAARPGRLPENLWSSDTTDLSIELLDQEKSLQARQFARLTRSTHGERQRDFEAILKTLTDLHRRVQEDGRP